MAFEEKTTLTTTSAVKEKRPADPSFFDPSTIPWTDWVMDGTYFKLLRVDQVSGSFTILLKSDPDIQTPLHKHTGSIEAYIVEGEFGYDDERGKPGDYVFEIGGSIHMPDVTSGVTMFAFVHGPIVGYNEDGSPAAVVDANFMYDLAKANGAADHIKLTHEYKD